MPTHLLVIEDEEQIRKNLVDLLRLSGFEVSSAANGTSGVALAGQYLPDLILCDIMMPQMDGYQVLQSVRTHPLLSHTPFIFLTAKADMVDLRQGMSLGADDYLTKPFTLNSLLGSIDSRLRREALRAATWQGQLAELRQTMYNVSTHEYNTPLTAILGFVSLLMDHGNEFDQADQQSMLAMIKVSSLRLKRSLDNHRFMRELEQVDALPATATYFSIGSSWLDTNVVQQQIQKVTDRHEQPVQCQLALKSAQIGLSESNLGIIIEELIDNAHKFSDGTHPVQLHGYPEGLTYQLRILNYGQLFKAADIARIGPYRQFDRKTYEQQGLGLGLLIVKTLLALNGGSMTIKSASGGGTSVVVTLPLKRIES